MNDLENILNFLQEARPFFYATVEDNAPRVRPFGFAMIYEDRLYFGMGTFKKSYAQTVSNPQFEISACNKDNVWIRIRGTAVEDTLNPGAREAAFAASPSLKNMYNETTGRTLGLFYVRDGVAEIADMKGGFSSMKI